MKLLRDLCTFGLKLFIGIAFSILLFGNLIEKTSAASTIQVTETSMAGWTYAAVIEPVYKLNGYDAPPIPRQFVRYGISAAISTPAFQGTKLSNITSLEYNSFDATPQSLPVIAIDILNLSSYANKSARGQLLYQPYYENQTDEKVVYSWNSQNNDLRGNWWFNGIGGENSCINFTPCTWSEVLATYPTAEIPVKGEIMIFRNNMEFQSSYRPVDTLVIGVLGKDTIYEFDLGESNEINIV